MFKYIIAFVFVHDVHDLFLLSIPISYLSISIYHGFYTICIYKGPPNNNMHFSCRASNCSMMSWKAIFPTIFYFFRKLKDNFISKPFVMHTPKALCHPHTQSLFLRAEFCFPISSCEE